MSEAMDLTTRGTPRIRRRQNARPKTSVQGLMGQAISLVIDRIAKQGGDPTAIIADIEAMIDRSDGCCEVTGIPFSDRYDGPGRRRPWLPTVDRIDASKGYVPGNMRLICCAANIALNDWGDEVFHRMVDAAYRKRHG